MFAHVPSSAIAPSSLSKHRIDLVLWQPISIFLVVGDIGQDILRSSCIRSCCKNLCSHSCCTGKDSSLLDNWSRKLKMSVFDWIAVGGLELRWCVLCNEVVIGAGFLYPSWHGHEASLPIGMAVTMYASNADSITMGPVQPKGVGA